jgi:Ca2+-binding EF-hand superfamily protein
MTKTAKVKFKKMDTDADEFITVAELKQALIDNPLITDEHVERVVTFFDNNLDRKISFTEFLPHAHVDTTAEAQFDEMDTDADEFITVAELKQALIDNPLVTDEHVERVVTFFDNDLDRRISFEEFLPHARQPQVIE